MDYLSIVLTHVLESHVPGLPGLGQGVGGMDYLSIVLTHVLESHVPGLPGLGQDVGGGKAPAVGHQRRTVVHRHLRLQALIPPRVWIRIHLSSWIRIRIQEGKKLPTNIEKSKEFSCFEVLDVLFGELKASPVACASFMEA